MTAVIILGDPQQTTMQLVSLVSKPPRPFFHMASLPALHLGRYIKASKNQQCLSPGMIKPNFLLTPFTFCSVPTSPAPHSNIAHTDASFTLLSGWFI